MSNDGKYSDKKLISDLLHQEVGVQAYERIFHRYYPMVLNFVKGMLKDNAMAEDVAQNIFMKLWVNRHSLSPDQSLKNYLCVIARNEVINILKSKHSKSIILPSVMPEAHLYDRSTEEWFNYSETNARLQKDIESMPAQRRTVFKMSRYEHLSNLEIAVKLNLSVRTVEKHIELALKDLRKSVN